MSAEKLDHTARARSLWGCIGRCFGSVEAPDAVIVEHKEEPRSRDSSSIEREMRIKQWVSESNPKLHELVVPDTNIKGSVTNIDEHQLAGVNEHEAIASKPMAGKVRRQQKAIHNRDKAMKCENLDPQFLISDNSLRQTTLDSYQQTTARSVGDTFRSMVPDAIDAITAYTPTSIRQKISEQTWFGAACTASRK